VTEKVTKPPSGRFRPREAVAVFCGSAFGEDPAFRENARALGRELARRSVTLVYGGGGVGLMSAVADGCLDGGGRVIGVIPSALVARELAHPRVSDLRVTDTMHERKAVMADLAQAFVAMPGGFGTLDEVFEAITWAQLGIHRKPIAFLDVKGFWRPLIAALDGLVRSGFVRPEHRALVASFEDPVALVDHVLSIEPPPPAVAWASPEQR
jgi:uncharacterized protein (TIGR00730 family)